MTSPYRVLEVYIEPGSEIVCSNCDWQGLPDALLDIEDCYLTAGDPSPAGRCPECEALTYVKEKI